MTVQNASKGDLQRHMVLEGTRTVNAFQVRWSNRWLAIGRGYDEDGDIAEFLNIPMPADGTLIPLSTGGTRTVNAAPNGILLGAWETLYYDPAPSGDVNQGSFLIVPYTDQIIMQDSAVWVAKRVGSQHIEWADRQRDSGDAVAADFWRNAVAGAADANSNLPDGTTDWSQDIQRRGRLGIGFVQAQTPVAYMDVAAAGRSGTDWRNAADPAHFTGNVTQGPAGENPASGQQFAPGGADPKFAFLHSNGTAGLVWGWNGIITQIGTSSHDVGLRFNGNSGQMSFQAPNIPAAGVFTNWWHRGTVPAPNTAAWQRIFSVNGAQYANEQVLVTGTVGNGNGTEMRWHLRNHAGSQLLRLWSVPAPAGNAGRLSVNPQNVLDDALLVLWGDPRTPAGQFSLGIRGSTLAYLTGAAGRQHAFFSDGASPADVLFFKQTAALHRVIMRNLPAGATQPGGLASGDLWRRTTDNVILMVP